MGLFNIFSKTPAEVAIKASAVVGTLNEVSREGINKTFIPKFLFDAPFGYARNVNIPLVRHLARSAYVQMCVNTIIAEISSIPWDIVTTDETEEPDEDEIKQIKSFFLNPNTNNESFNDVFIDRPVRDMLEVNSGVLVKVFNMKEEMVEVVARDGCLPYNTYIDTDKGSLRIGQIVKNKLDVNVKSYNLETKQLEFKPITNWFSNGTTTKWLKLNSISNNKRRVLTCTPNHKIYTSEGYKLAGDLKIGDKLLTLKDNLSEDEFQLILGSIMGDASIGKSNRGKYVETHSIKEKEYLLYKKESLDRFDPNYYEYWSVYSDKHEPTQKCRFSTKSNLVFNEFKDLKYPILKKEVFDLLDLRALAIWIQDDGYCYHYGSIEISTHKYPKDVLEYGQEILKSKWGFESKLRKDNRFEDMWILNFDKSNSLKLIEKIKQYIHPSMCRKVNLKPEEVGSDILIKEGTGQDVHEITLTDIKEYEKYDTKYDMEVKDNHNYFAQGKLISNSSFLKNPDIHGMFTDREDILLPKEILLNSQDQQVKFPLTQINVQQARNKAAYFQFGSRIVTAPVPYGKREIIFIEKLQRTDEIYGESPVEVLFNTLQMLLYMVDSDLDYYRNNNVPKGIVFIEGIDADELDSFRRSWMDNQRVKDEFGQWRKIFSSVPIVSKKPEFVNIEFSASEMQVIEKQKWYSQLVWANFGVTSTELGYTQDAKGMSNQIVQSKVFRKKAINPILTQLEYAYTHSIIPELGFLKKEGELINPKYKFKFLTFDIDEEKNKWDLYKTQVDSGIKTVNEIRGEEGLEEKEGGDELRKKNMSFNGEGFNPFQNGSQEQEPQEPNKKPFNKKEEEAIKTEVPNKKKDKKAQTMDSSLILKEFETPYSPKALMKELKKILSASEKELKKLIDREMGPDIIKNLKSSTKSLGQFKNFNDCVAQNQDKDSPETFCGLLMGKIEGKALEEITLKLDDLLSTAGIKSIVDKMVRGAFLKGWDSSEEQLNVNLPVNNTAIRFLQTHTFENVKGMNEDLANKLRQTIERGIIDGKTANQLKSEIADTFDASLARANTIARTELSRANNNGKLLAMKASDEDVRKYLIITHDDRTTEVSKAMDRKYGTIEKSIPVDEVFSVNVGGKEYAGQAPPFMWNDRDTLVFTVV